MIDFDKLFEKYFSAWYADHADEYETEDALENTLTEIYEAWCSTSLKELGGKTPYSYFDDISDPSTLVSMLIEFDSENISPCILLTDKIERTRECAEDLKKIIGGDYSEDLKVTAINLINAIGVSPQIDILCELALGENESESLREISVETLSIYPNDAAPLIYPRLDTIGIDAKLRAAEILCLANKDERTFNLLKELLKLRHNIPLCAGLLGKYGDERAVFELYPLLDACNYFEYIEIKNAIERLGGSVDDIRDFSDDPYFKIIKGTK